MTLVPRPFGRGRALSSYSQAAPSLRLMVLRNSASRARDAASASPRSSRSRAGRAAAVGAPRRRPPLRVQRRALVGIAGHARQDLRHERLLVIGGLHDPLERVTAHAVKQRELLLLRARHAHDPLAVRKL